MRRVLGFLFVLAGASSAVAVANTAPSSQGHPTAAQSAAPVKLAPADEYFGPMKMSVLGIRNEIHDLMIRYEPTWDADHHLANAVMGTAVMTEKSLHDWEQKYPADTQLPRYIYLLQHLYAKIQTDDGQAKAKVTAQWLLARYGNSWYAKNLRVTVTQTGPAHKADPATAAAPATQSQQATASSSDTKPASQATVVPVPASAPAAAATAKP